MPTLPASLPLDFSIDVELAALDIANAVSIAGRVFLLDIGNPSSPYGKQWYRRTSARLERDQFDQSREAGEQSLGDGWWRRSQSDFSGGAGQVWLDKEASNRTRFRSSKGIDCFSYAPELRLLGDTQHALTSSSTNLFLAQAMDSGTTYLYVADNQTLKRTSDPYSGPPATFTSITGTPAAAIDSIASSGQYVYTAHSGNDIYRSAVSGTTAALWSSQDATLIRWVKNRIMGALANVIYEYDSTGTATARHTHWNAGMIWTDFTAIGPAILAAGYAGEKSTILRFNVNTDGTLATAVEAVEGGLPDGEIIRCLESYLGFVFIGTNKGVRLATHDSDGNLTYGPLIPVDLELDVRCFEPQGAFVWFGWTNYDASGTGLGRLDLRTFTADLRPAYASDLLAATQGTVVAIATHGTKRCFAVSGSGVWSETAAQVASGSLQTSKAAYGISEYKIAKFLNTNSVIGSGSITPQIAGDDDIFGTLGDCNEDQCEITTNSLRSTAFSLLFTFTGIDAFKDYTLKSLPAFGKQRIFEVPLLLYDSVLNDVGMGMGYPGKALEDLEYLEALEDVGDEVAYEDLTSGPNGTRRFSVVIENLDMVVRESPTRGNGFGGTLYARLRKIDT